ncbi:MAG: hypothetical protein ACK56I_33660, partial [bacterium]
MEPQFNHTVSRELPAEPLPYWARDDTRFTAANLQYAVPFWRDVLLPAAALPPADSAKILGWLSGVSIESMFKPFTGVFAGRQYASDTPLTYHARNHPVPLDARSFV